VHRLLNVLVSRSGTRAPERAERNLLSQVTAEALKADWQVQIYTDTNRFSAASIRADCGLIIVPWLPTDPSHSWLREITVSRPGWPLLLLTHAASDNLRNLAQIVVTGVIFIEDVEELGPMLLGLARLRGGALVLNRIEISNMHVTLKRALRWYLHFPIPESRGHAAGTEIPRTVADLASRLHKSRSYLSRLASQNGVRLGRFVDSVLALKGLELIAAGTREEEVALRLGYASSSGFSHHVLRVFGRRPSELLGDVPNLWVQVADMIPPAENASSRH
jgi:AraC-like DNA-binding protein